MVLWSCGGYWGCLSVGGAGQCSLDPSQLLWGCLSKPAGPLWVLQHPWVPGSSEHCAAGALGAQPGAGYLPGCCRGGFSSRQRFGVLLLCEGEEKAAGNCCCSPWVRFLLSHLLEIPFPLSNLTSV